LSMLSRLPFLLLIAAGGLHAGAAANVDPLVAAAAKHERGVLKAAVEGHPLVETYLQYTPKGSSSPQKDTYSLGSINQRKSLSEDAYQQELATSLSGRLFSLAKDIGIGKPEEVTTLAFVDMLSPDLTELDAQHYRFEFHRYVFVGARRMAVYDVSPASNRKALQRGRFLGRIWIDQHDGVIAHYNGVFIGSSRDKTRPDYLHFDSWRIRTDAGTWLPYAIYIEEPIRGSIIHGQLRFWGYHLERLNLQRDSNMTNIQVDNAVDQSTSDSDVSPLEASNLWRMQAESNVMDRLESAGLLAPAGDFEKILDQIVINLSVPSNLDFSAPVHCRILLSLPVEATVADHTILLSKGLIDTIPTEEALASVLAVELAHIQLGHRLDTRYAFSDRMMFANTQTYENIRLVHTPADNEDAAKLAQKYIAASLYGDKNSSISAYYSVLDDASRRLPELTHGYLADSLLGPDARPWLHGWLQNVSLKAVYETPSKAPLPLSSALRIDPESDQLHQILPRVGPSSPAEIHPFEILPVVLNYRLDEGGTISALQAH
jgi:hypothetical protein